MPLDMSIYQNLLRPPKSVAELDAEAMQGQTNRLALQSGQAQLQDRQRAIDDGNKLRQLVSGFGQDQGANYNMLLGAGQLDAAQKYVKSNADVAKVQADAKESTAKTAKSEQDVGVRSFDSIAQTMGALRNVPGGATKQHVATAVQHLVDVGILRPEMAGKVVQAAPDNPAEMPQWLATQQAAALTAKEQLPTVSTRNLGGTTDTLSVNPVTQEVKVVSSVKNSQTPDSIASNERIRREGDANRQNALAVQDKITARQADPVIAPPQSNGLTGQQFLGSIDKPTADQVKALAEGRLAFPSGKALQSDYWQKMISAVSQYDPSFDAVNYNARSKTRNDFVAGKSADNIKSLNTAIAHMGQLDEQLSALGNSASPTYNKVSNWMGNNLGNTSLQGKLAAAGATAEGVAGEMAKVFRSTGMSEHEINAWREKFDSSTTPAQQKGTMQSAMHMLQGRMDALSDQYKTGMGTTAAPMTMLTPKAQAIFDRLSGSTASAAAAPTPAAPSVAPVKVANAADYAKLPSGAQYVDPAGHTRRKP